MFKIKTSNEKKSFKEFTGIASVADIVDYHLPAYGDNSAIRFDTGDTYQSISFGEYLQHIKAMIRYFIAGNIEGKVVATFCKNRIEWDMVAMATFYTANTIFPLDTKTNMVELKHLLKLNPPDYILVSKAQLQRIESLCGELGIQPIILLADYTQVFEDQGVVGGALSSRNLSIRNISIQHISIRDIMLDAAQTAAHIELVPSPKLNDPDTILGHYPTSGTTNLPKIVQISHGNIVHEVNEAIDVINLRVNEELLNIGPYTHIATLVEFLVTKTRGFSVTYFTREPDDDDVLEDEIKKLKKLGVRIKVLMAVPKFWIYLLKELLEEMKNKPVLQNLYQHLSSIEKNDKLYDIGTLDKAKLTAMRILLRNKLGGYFSYGISSSMKLDGALVEIFGKLGITVIDIYGATECSGIISRNRLNDLKPGSCGRMINMLEYRFANCERIPGIDREVGILEVKGPTIMHSYLGMNGDTPLTDDGFYSTGDLCWEDDEGFLHIVGRKKELTRWDDGTYIDPQYLSNLLVRSIFVKDALVTRLNPEDDFLSVYIFPDYKRIKKDPAWRKEIATGIGEDAALRSRLETAIDFAQSIANITPALSKKTIYILPKALERTPTHKIKFIFELQRLHLARAI
ncbi:MAG: AMP-binding protein [Gammaproteobacteria bacterium]|jgi:long-subunit acyl-CoA synthetase (AMP-forming)